MADFTKTEIAALKKHARREYADGEELAGIVDIVMNDDVRPSIDEHIHREFEARGLDTLAIGGLVESANRLRTQSAFVFENSMHALRQVLDSISPDGDPA